MGRSSELDRRVTWCNSISISNGFELGHPSLGSRRSRLQDQEFRRLDVARPFLS
jgi:hypothetical protein